MTAKPIGGALMMLAAACIAQDYKAAQVEDHGVAILTDTASGV